MNIPEGEGTFDIHFYRNEVTGKIYYYDYKVKLGGGERR
jgi:hypothetical protein